MVGESGLNTVNLPRKRERERERGRGREAEGERERELTAKPRGERAVGFVRSLSLHSGSEGHAKH